MTRLQKIFMGLLILAVISLTVYSLTLMGYCEKEKKKAMHARQAADYNAEVGKEQAELAARAMAEAAGQVEQLKAELEACKGKK